MATARIPAEKGTPALSKGCQRAQPQQQTCQQQQDLCGKAIKVAGNTARNIAVNVALIKKNLVVMKCHQVAVVFSSSSSSEGLQGSGNTRPKFGTIKISTVIWKVHKKGLLYINTVYLFTQ